MKKLKVYVGCALTHSTEEYRQQIADFKDRLRELPNVEVLDFVGLENATSEEVYEHDIHYCVATCDLFIAECSHPAIGLGYELGVAVDGWKKPTIAFFGKDIKVTRLVQGLLCKRNPHFESAYYSSLDELVDISHQKILALQAN